MKRFPLIFLLVLGSAPAYPQGGDTPHIRHEYDIAAESTGMAMTMRHDQQGRPFLYVASKEAGLKIYNVSAAPVLVKTIPITAFGALHAMNLSQTGHTLYLALGNSFMSANQPPGFAMIDVTTPANASIVSYWTDTQLKGGGGIVECRGHYVYLGAMKNGLMIFDVADKHHPTLVSTLVPDIHFPDARADPTKFNARGLAIHNDLVYLCYDAGGLHVVNVADKAHPVEVGRYANPAMNGKPRAYNNIVVDGSLAYVTVDYVGLEVLNVADPSKITLVSWWNPWNPTLNGWNWFKSEGHANEIAYDQKHKWLFIAAGKNDLVVLNVAQPASPQLVATYGGPDNDLGTWGVSLYEDRIYLSYVWAIIPFTSKWTGVKSLRYGK